MSSVAKTLQFDSETSLESVLEKGIIERPVFNLPSVLQPLVGQVAETAEERYRLLEQRDKLLRQGTPIYAFVLCAVFVFLALVMNVKEMIVFFCP